MVKKSTRNERYNLQSVRRSKRAVLGSWDHTTKDDASHIKVTRAFFDEVKGTDDEEAALTTFQLRALRHVEGEHCSLLQRICIRFCTSPIRVYFRHTPLPVTNGAGTVALAIVNGRPFLMTKVWFARGLPHHDVFCCSCGLRFRVVFSPAGRHSLF